MGITQRQVVLAVIGIQVLGSLLLLVSQVVARQAPLLIGLTGGAVTLYAALWVAYYRGWDYARYMVIAMITILTAVGLPEPYVTEQASFSALTPAIMALVLAGPWWVVGSAATVIVSLIIRAGGTGIYADPITLVIFSMLVGGMVLSRIVTNYALQSAETNAAQAAQAQHAAEQTAQEQARTAAELRVQNEQQQQLLTLVSTLETPSVMLADGVILAPLIGHLDTRRAQQFTQRLLADVSDQRARLVIIDIAGVATVDTAVAQALLQAARALRLLGCQVAISGISASVATTLTHLGVQLDGITTARSPQDALTRYQAQTALIEPVHSFTRQPHVN